MPLNEAPVGHECLIIAVNGQKREKAQLAGMGIHPGTVMRVLGSCGPGQFIVQINNASLALGNSTTATIHVI